MKRTISKQKFYEEAIMKTYEYRVGSQSETEMTQIGDIPDTFSELMLKRTLFGFKDNIPRKHPFDKLGFSYVHQLMGMAIHIQDDEFTHHLFQFMNSNLELFDFKSQEQMDVCYDLFYETLTGEYGYRDFNQNMTDFILKNFDKSLEYYDKVVSLAYSLGACKYTSYTELVNIRSGLEGLDTIEDFGVGIKKLIDNENHKETMRM